MSYGKNICIKLLLFSLSANFLVAQNMSEISGRIIDAKSGEGLYGATIFYDTYGTSSGFDGDFIISVPKNADKLNITYIGYTSQEVLIEDAKALLVELEVSSNLLQTAVITGAKYEITLGESVVSLDVLKPQLLENTNTNNVEDIFNKIPGVQMVDGQPNIRSGSGWSYNAGNRVMLLINDIPALQPDAGRATWDDIPVENIAQIEVVKGAGSTLYGSAAMNGVINVRTAYATSEPSTKISLFHTRFDNYSDERKNWYRTSPFNHTPQDIGFSLSHKQKIGKWDIVLGSYYFNQDSTKSYRREDFKYKLRGNVNVRYRASDRLTIGLNTIVNKGRSSSFFLWKNGTIGALQPLEGTVTRSENIRYTIDPQITYFDKKNNRHRFQSRIYYNDNDNNLNQSNRSKMIYGEYQFQTSLSDNTKATFGAVANRATSDSQFFENADVNQTNIAAFVQADHTVGSKLRFSGGLRYEYNKQHNDAIKHSTITVPEGDKVEDKIIARLGMNYQLSEGTFLRGSIGQAYRFPIMIERFLSTEFGGFLILPNPDLMSETGVTTEIGIKKTVKFGGFRGYVDLTAYSSSYSDMMEFVFVSTPIFGFQSRNIGDTQIKGIEFSIAGRYTLGTVPIDIYGGVNLSDPTYQDFDGLSDFLQSTSSTTENVLKYRSRNSYTVDIQSQIDRTSFGLGWQGAGHVIAVDKILETFITDLKPYREFNNNGYGILDFRVGYELNSFKFSMHFKNVLNEEYTQRPGIIEAPRNIGFRMDITL